MLGLNLEEGPNEAATDSVTEFDRLIAPWAMSCNPNKQLGPEIWMASKSFDKEEGNIMKAVAVRKIFDSKASSKILCFFVPDTPLNELLGKWVAYPKTGKPGGGNVETVFDFCSDERHKSDGCRAVEERLKSNCWALTLYQCDAAWFSIHLGYIARTLGTKIHRSTTLTGAEEQWPQLLKIFIDSWFSCSQSTDAMLKGTCNEGAVVQALQRCKHVKCVFEVGLLESLETKWLAVSPDGVCIFNRDLLAANMKRLSAETALSAAEATGDNNEAAAGSSGFSAETALFTAEGVGRSVEATAGSGRLSESDEVATVEIKT